MSLADVLIHQINRKDFLNLNDKITSTLPNLDIKTYTIEEVAIQLGISKKTAYAIIRDGMIHSVRVGRSIRVSKESFERWLNHY